MTEERSYGSEIAGRCPACKAKSLFMGVGGHVTCSRLDCPAPTAVDDALHEDGYAITRSAELTELRARVEQAEAAIAHIRALHPSRSEARAAKNVLCPECAQVAPCRTRAQLDALPESTDTPSDQEQR